MEDCCGTLRRGSRAHLPTTGHWPARLAAAWVCAASARGSEALHRPSAFQPLPSIRRCAPLETNTGGLKSTWTNDSHRHVALKFLPPEPNSDRTHHAQAACNFDLSTSARNVHTHTLFSRQALSALRKRSNV